MSTEQPRKTLADYVAIAISPVLIMALVTMWESAAQQRAARYAAPAQTSGTGAAATEAGPVTEPGTGFPVPPLDLPHYHGVGVENQTQASSKEVTGA